MCLSARGSHSEFVYKKQCGRCARDGIAASVRLIALTCHAVSHHHYNQFRHWGPFISQEGSGAFDPNAPDIPDVPDDVASIDSDMPLDELAAKRQKTAVPASSSNARKVQRYAMARTTDDQMMPVRGQMKMVPGQKQMLEQDAQQHDKALLNWTIENRLY